MNFKKIFLLVCLEIQFENFLRIQVLLDHQNLIDILEIVHSIILNKSKLIFFLEIILNLTVDDFA
jgi:hypothetical protein